MLADSFRVDGRVAIVTGASRGIGAATALALAGSGADLVVSARNPEALAALAAKVENDTGKRAFAIPADLNDLDSLPPLVEAAKAEFGRLDVLVNNVGGTMPRPFLDTSPGYLERAFHFNVTVAFQLTRLAAPVMLAGEGGSVVNVASAIGRLVDRGFVAYGTAKAALIHMSRLIALDLAPRIRVNVVAPGAIETEALGTVLTDEMRQTMIGLTPARRLGRVEDIASAILYLASDAGSYLTGKVIEADGGQHVANLPLGLPDL
ncbi:MAG TPA: glucose 1-dehydrogenase [Acidimicrobiales bacterium]|nr:glucose 1-dehydrogenase [Acidimicrobiales bacterium]